MQGQARSLVTIFYYFYYFWFFPFFMFSMAHGTKSETKYPPTINVWERVQPVFLFSPPSLFLFSFFSFLGFMMECRDYSVQRACIYHTVIWYLTSKALHKEGHT
ncbi:hypothetical protein GGI35DRAFT_165783 [Trichoderma velutinum]